MPGIALLTFVFRALHRSTHVVFLSWFVSLFDTKHISIFANSNYWARAPQKGLGNAAGLDKDGSLLEFNYCIGAGFAVVGTVLNKPHTGNIVKIRGKEHNPWAPLPHSHSALNSLGLPSLGIDASIKNILEFKFNFLS